MNVECPKCNTKQAINDPTEPTPFGKVGVKCSNCGKMFDVDNKLGDDMYTATEDLFPPGERFVAKGERITFEKARALGVIDKSSKPVKAEEEE